MELNRDTRRFENRRQRLMADHPSAVFLFYSGEEAVRNSSVHYPFRVDSDFLYFTGFTEPEAWLLLSSAGVQLFSRKRDPLWETWNGPIRGPDGARDETGISDCRPLEDLDPALEAALMKAKDFYFTAGREARQDAWILERMKAARDKMRMAGRVLVSLKDPRGAIESLRLRKDETELAQMRRAAAITAAGHARVMTSALEGLRECDLAADLEHEFIRRGAERTAYQTIVASGRNALCLHHRPTEKRISSGELLLIDAGAEFGGYACDVTRTFPGGLDFTREQAEVYDAVLAAQEAAFQLCRPGETIGDIHRAATTVLRSYLNAQHPGLRLEDVFPHHTSHWIGLDVHDVGSYFEGDMERKLEAGMTFTVEPGLYFREGLPGLRSDYVGIGVRIEDNVAITETGVEILTKEIPKSRAEIVALRAFSRG